MKKWRYRWCCCKKGAVDAGGGVARGGSQGSERMEGWEEPADQEYNAWGREGAGRVADAAGGGSVEHLELEAGLAEAGGRGEVRGWRPGAVAGPVGGGSGDLRRGKDGWRKNLYSVGGVVVGEEVGHAAQRNTSTKRSRFRFRCAIQSCV